MQLQEFEEHLLKGKNTLQALDQVYEDYEISNLDSDDSISYDTEGSLDGALHKTSTNDNEDSLILQ